MEAIIQALLTQGAVGIVAALALFLLDKAYKDQLRREAQAQEIYRADRSELISVIRENARTMTALQQSIETSQRTIEALLYERPDLLNRPGRSQRPPRSAGHENP